MRVMIDCKEATRLVLAGEDRQLALGERVNLRLHLWVCRTCPTFVRQTRLMRGAMDRWRSYRDELPGPDDEQR